MTSYIISLFFYTDHIWFFFFCFLLFESEQCDLFSGEWIPNPSGPAYTNASCRFIEDHQNCMLNGKPDTGYLYWKWKPYGCDIPPLDAKKFLDAMRNRSWALIGDSILRNHAQSLICLLSKVFLSYMISDSQDCFSCLMFFLFDFLAWYCKN